MLLRGEVVEVEVGDARGSVGIDVNPVAGIPLVGEPDARDGIPLRPHFVLESVALGVTDIDDRVPLVIREERHQSERQRHAAGPAGHRPGHAVPDSGGYREANGG